jgi:hypothetical protein
LRRVRPRTGRTRERAGVSSWRQSMIVSWSSGSRPGSDEGRPRRARRRAPRRAGRDPLGDRRGRAAARFSRGTVSRAGIHGRAPGSLGRAPQPLHPPRARIGRLHDARGHRAAVLPAAARAGCPRRPRCLRRQGKPRGPGRGARGPRGGGGAGGPARTGGRGTRLRWRHRGQPRTAGEPVPDLRGADSKPVRRRIERLSQDPGRGPWRRGALLGAGQRPLGGPGTAPNVIADSARAEILFRSGEPVETLLSRIRPAASGRVELEVPYQSDPILFRVPRVPGGESSAEIVSFACDLPLLPAWGEPILVGPGSILDAHAPEEKVELAQIEEAVAVYSKIARGLLDEGDAYLEPER